MSGLPTAAEDRRCTGFWCVYADYRRILPMIDPWRQVQPIHVLEVARGLLQIMDHQESGWFGLASSDGVAFGAFLKTLAAELHGKSLSIFPIPLKLALLACEIAARLPLAPKIDKERILGLAGTRHVDTADHLKTLGLFLMPLVVGLRREPLCRKAILAEARTFFCYILAKRPGGTLLRRYAKAIILKQNGAPLPLPPGVRIFPTLLHLVEPLKSGQLHVRLRWQPPSQRLARKENRPSPRAADCGGY